MACALVRSNAIALALTLGLMPACFPDPSPSIDDLDAGPPPSGGGGNSPPPVQVTIPNRLDPPFTGPMNPQWVMELAGGSPGPHVDHGPFWPPDRELGSAWWEAWIMPLPNHQGYFISDGYGGGHAVLIGTNGDGSISGNMWGGPLMNADASFANQTMDAFAVGEWVHVAVGYERTRLKAVLIYVNGMLSGYIPRPHARWSAPPSTGAGTLYVGGSNHQNFGGRIAWVRAFDNDVFPRDPATALQAFRPRKDASTVEVGTGVQGGVLKANATFSADFLASYQLPPGTKIIPDLATAPRSTSPPRMLAVHPGKAQFSVPPAIDPLPRFVLDETAPFGPGPHAPRPQMLVTPTKLPYAAKIFDSFARANRDLTHDADILLGDTEGGSLGTRTWSTLPGQPFGIRNGYAVFLGDHNLSPAWVDSDSGNQDIEIAHGGYAGKQFTGGGAIVFRMSDPANLWLAFVSSPMMVTVRKVVAGQVTDFGPYPLPSTWFAVLNVRAQDDVIQVFADKADGTVEEIAKLTDSFNATATKVGFASAGGSLVRINAFLLQAYPR